MNIILMKSKKEGKNVCCKYGRSEEGTQNP